jgi:hypothetical protein
MLFRETVAVYCENHMEHTDTVRLGRISLLGVTHMRTGFTVDLFLSGRKSDV